MKTKVVYTRTQKQWDIVLENSPNTVGQTSNDWEKKREKSCICLPDCSSADIGYIQMYPEHYDLDTFDDWYGRMFKNGLPQKISTNPTKVEETCEKCNGEGRFLVAKLYPQGHTEVNETCDECNGEGTMIKKIVVLVKTQAEFDRVFKSFKNSLDSTDFENYNSKTGICLADGTYGSLGHFEDYKDEYSIISYNEWLNGEPESNDTWEPKVGDFVVFMPDVAEMLGLKTEAWDREMILPISRITNQSFHFQSDYLNKKYNHFNWGIKGECGNDKRTFKQLLSKTQSPQKSSPTNTVINIPLVIVPKKDNINITVKQKKNTIKIPLINENKFAF